MFFVKELGPGLRRDDDQAGMAISSSRNWRKADDLERAKGIEPSS
jgi:hypothetical protein